MEARNIYITTCVALMTLASCHKEEVYTGPCDVRFRAYLQDEVSVTRTSYTEIGDTVPPPFTAGAVVEMGDKEKEIYDNLCDDMVVSLGESEIDAVNAASLSNKLLQMANGAVYSADQSVIEIHDHKLDALEDLIEAANGKPVLVAYWFKHDLERIADHCSNIAGCYIEMSERKSLELHKYLKKYRDTCFSRSQGACI